MSEHFWFVKAGLSAMAAVGMLILPNTVSADEDTTGASPISGYTFGTAESAT